MFSYRIHENTSSNGVNYENLLIHDGMHVDPLAMNLYHDVSFSFMVHYNLSSLYGIFMCKRTVGVD